MSESEKDTKTPFINPDELARKHGEKILKHTCDLGRPPFWRAYKKVPGFIRDHPPKLPEGVKPYPDVAQVFLTDQMFKMGMVELRYHDGMRTALTLKELAPIGDTIDIDNITEKWVVCGVGDKDLTGKVHT